MKMRLLTHEEVLKEALKNPEFKKLYEESELNYRVASALIGLRIRLKLTQKEVAKRLGIRQQSYSELEQMEGRNYTIDLLQKIARVTGTELYIRGNKAKFLPMKHPTQKRAA